MQHRLSSNPVGKHYENPTARLVGECFARDRLHGSIPHKALPAIGKDLTR